MNKWVTRVGMACCITALCIAGACSSKKNSEVEKEGQVTITWWTFPVFSQENAKEPVGTYERTLIDAFEEENPDIRVKLKTIDFTTGPEKIQAAIQNEAMGDVLFDAPGRIISYGKEGDLVDLSDLFTEEYCKDVENENLLDACSADGAYYMYPLSSGPFYMAFNKERLKDAGVLDLVREGFTTEDLTTVLKALKEKGYMPGSLFYQGTGGDQGTRALVSNLYDCRILNEDLTAYQLEEPEGKKAVDYIKNAVEEGMMRNGTFENGSSDIADFASGESSFTLVWSTGQQATWQELLDENEVEPVEVPFPSEDGVPELEYLVNGFCIFDNGDEDKIKASSKFIQFLCDDEVYGPENVVRTGCFPVRKSFGELYTDERMKRIQSWTAYYGTYYNNVEGYSKMRQYWNNLLKEVLRSGEDTSVAIQDFVRQSDQSLVTEQEGGQ